MGIIGLPNAGKSTLISSLSSAKPKIADYPFTTLIPNLGVVRKPTGDGTVFADIPGLIEGASDGIGLGHDFLRHIERTRVLVHLVDVNSNDPIHDYQVIQAELSAYGRGLCDRPQIIGLNKIDSMDEESQQYILKEFQGISNDPIFLISGVAGTGCNALLQAVWNQLDLMKEDAVKEISFLESLHS